MKKKLTWILTLLAFLLLIPQESKAVDEVETLIILMKNGTENTFFLKDKPKVTFEGVNLKVSATTGDVSFALADVLRFTYDKRSTTGINEQVTTPTGVADGKLIRQLKPHRAGTYRISLSGLPSGLYLVKADNVTYKITKR